MIDITAPGNIHVGILLHTWSAFNGACKPNADKSKTLIEWDETVVDEPTLAEIAAAVTLFEKDKPEKWEYIRAKRNQLMVACDWMTMADSPDISDAWKTYRQALRDLPASKSDPDDIVFPDEPS